MMNDEDIAWAHDSRFHTSGISIDGYSLSFSGYVSEIIQVLRRKLVQRELFVLKHRSRSIY